MPMLSSRAETDGHGEKIFFVTGEDGVERRVRILTWRDLARAELTPEERKEWDIRHRFAPVESWPDPIEKPHS